MHCLYAVNMLLQIYVGQHVVVLFRAHNLMNTLPVWYLDAAHMLLITYYIYCPPLHVGLCSEEFMIKMIDDKMKDKKFSEVLNLGVDEVDKKKK